MRRFRVLAAASLTVVCIAVAGGSAAFAASAVPTLPSGLYAAQESGDFLEFGPGATGNAVPALQLSYGTQIADVAEEPDGDLYLTDPNDDELLTLGPGRGAGCECPVLAGSSTGLVAPVGVATDGTGHLWVTNAFGNSIEEFAKDSIGNKAPMRVITGARTGLSEPIGIAVGADGGVFVANTGAGSIEEFTAGARGNAKPVAVIAGSTTTLVKPAFLSLDASGDLWVTDENGNAVDEFGSGASGDVAPVARIAGSHTGLRSPEGVALDSAGTVYVDTFGNGSIREFAAGVTGNVSPTALIKGNSTGLVESLGLMLAPAQALLVQTTHLPAAQVGVPYRAKIALSGAGNVTPDVWSVAGLPAGLSFHSKTHTISGKPTAIGSSFVSISVTDSARHPHEAQSLMPLQVGPPPPALFVPSGTANAVSAYPLPFTSSDEAPSQTITGAGTGLDEPTGVAVEPDGRLYVGNAGNNSVTEYAYGANGDAAPLATISGPDTGLDVPGKLVLDSSGYLFVTNNLDATVTEYAPGASGDAAPVATLSGFDRVGGITAGDGLVAVGDSEANSVTTYTDSAGSLTPSSSLAGADTQLDGPTGMGIDDNGHLFVANAGGASITSWAAGTSGDTAPSTDLTGVDTELDVSADVAADADGDIFVANLGSGTITEYPADATGDTAPTAALTGPDTQVSDPAALAILP